jgi:tetratricopeptide (TPR) repeat protein
VGSVPPPPPRRRSVPPPREEPITVSSVAPIEEVALPADLIAPDSVHGADLALPTDLTHVDSNSIAEARAGLVRDLGFGPVPSGSLIAQLGGSGHAHDAAAPPTRAEPAAAQRGALRNLAQSNLPPAPALSQPLSDGDAAEFKVLPGHIIANRYQVLDVIGEGGMGIVYRCFDLATRERVALKRVIVPDGALASEYLMWFYKEARALAALNHANIVSALDYGQLEDGSPFLVMELATGVSLHELSQVRMPFELIWSVVDQILGALAHAHAKGIVHGDLKPSNVLVEELEDQPPSAHILDFGLAWLKQDFHDERLDGSKAVTIAPHAGAGTPGYMAPEQIQHEMHHVCGATDLYSLGCVLYKLLTGTPPFVGESKDLLRLHAYEKPPEPRLAVSAPPEVAGFLMRLLAKRPWDRWEFAADARAEWARWRPSVGVDPAVYRFPQLPGAQRDGGAETRKTGPIAPVAGNVAQEKASGLLRMRPSPFVGREDVRQQLRDICDEVIDGEGPAHRFVILLGPAGVGKSRLAEWLCEVVHEEGAMVPLRARYRKVPGSLDGMLGAVTYHFNFERADRETIERSLMSRWSVAKYDKKGKTWVAGVAEWLRPMPPGDQVGPTGVRFALDTLETRRLVIRHTLIRIANGRPLLFWLDDLHLAPQSTFDGLLRIHNEEPNQRIVIVATVRSEDVQLDAAATERLRQLREALDGEVVQVKSLDPDSTAQLVRASLPLEDAAVTEAVRRSRGNPLFALQQLHAWVLAGELEFRDGVYCVPQQVLEVRPQTTAELWDSRVAAMPAAHRLAAYAVATLGGDIRRSVLFPLLRSLGLSANEAIVSLQNAEIILPRGPGRYVWPHALLQEHLLTRLRERPDVERVFAASAEALTAHPLANTRRIVRQRVANLMSAGRPDAGAELLFEFLQQAWNGAREPLATLADLELLKGFVTGRSLALQQRWRAEALRHVGRVDEALSHAEIARAMFEEIGDQENLAHCLRQLGHLTSERGSSADGRALVEQAYQIFQELDDVLGLAMCEAVLGEIEYLLGSYETARVWVERAEEHFARLSQPLGRGQCLLLLSWIDHSEGATERSRRLTLEARTEFERAGYRLGIAQANASLAHVEHRLMNYYSAERGAQDALGSFETLRTPRGQAACERLLAMIALDTDDRDLAEIHADRAMSIYQKMGDPWGAIESMLLKCQVLLAHHRLDAAREVLEQCAAVRIEEAEPRQHYLLTQAWYFLELGDSDKAFEALDAASDVFGQRSRAGDHTPHLLSRLSRLRWPAHAHERIDAWLAVLNDRSRRVQE